MTPYAIGRKIAKEGYSIHFNPYRHKGSAQDYCEFVEGFQSVKKAAEVVGFNTALNPHLTGSGAKRKSKNVVKGNS